MFHRYAVLIEYDGSRFYGFQNQGHLPTVQKFLEETIRTFAKEDIRVYCAGRTDTGVHALGQVIHFDVERELDAYKLQGCINYFGQTEGIAALEVVKVDNKFHCRFSAMERRYAYIICNRAAPSAILHKRIYQVMAPLNVQAMQEAAEKLVGHHNFESFRSSHCQAPNPERTLKECRVSQEGEYIITTLRARAFLHNQVRITMGTLIGIGLGRRDPAWIDDLLKLQDRTQAGKTAPPYGLYFMGVGYEERVFTKQPQLMLFPTNR